MIDIGSMYARLGVNTRGLNTAERHLRRFRRGATRSLGGVASAATMVKGALIMAGVYLSLRQITGMLRAAAREAMEFEVAVARLGTVSDQELGIMADRIRGLGAELGSLTDLAKGYYGAISAGAKEGEEALEVLTVAAQVATEAQIQQDQVTRGLAAITRSYGDQLQDTADAADLLYAIERDGITTVQELIPHMGKLVLMADSTSLSVNEMAGSLAALTRTGAGTAESATMLEGLLVALGRRFDDLPPAITEYGNVQRAVEAIGFEGTLREIWEATDGCSRALTEMLGRKEALVAMQALATNNFEHMGEAIDSVGERTDLAGNAFDRYQETLKAQWEVFKETILRQGVAIAEELMPHLSAVLDITQKWLDLNDDFIKEDMAGVIGEMGLALSFVLDAAHGTYKTFRGIATAIGTILGFTVTGIAGIVEWLARMNEGVWRLLDMIPGVDAGAHVDFSAGARRQVEDFRKTMDVFTEQMAGEFVDTFTSPTLGAQLRLAKTMPATERAKMSPEDYFLAEGIEEKMGETWEKIYDELDKAEPDARKIQRLYGALEGSVEEYQEAIEAGHFDRKRMSRQQADKSAKNLEKNFAQFGDYLSDFFPDSTASSIAHAGIQQAQEAPEHRQISVRDFERPISTERHAASMDVARKGDVIVTTCTTVQDAPQTAERPRQTRHGSPVEGISVMNDSGKQ